jgi:hypothetical protein
MQLLAQTLVGLEKGNANLQGGRLTTGGKAAHPDARDRSAPGMGSHRAA